MLALALAVGFLTFVPALSSVLLVSSAWSDRSDVGHSPSGGSSIVHKNGATPAWIADLLEEQNSVAGIEFDAEDGYSI